MDSLEVTQIVTVVTRTGATTVAMSSGSLVRIVNEPGRNLVAALRGLADAYESMMAVPA